MKSQSDRDHAETLFCVAGLTLAQVAAESGVGEGTLKRWSKEGDWVRKRDEQRAAPRRALDTVNLRIAALMDKMTEDPDQDAVIEDRLTKLLAIRDKIESRYTIDGVLKVMDEFAMFTRGGQFDEADMNVLREAVAKFLAEKRKEYS